MNNRFSDRWTISFLLIALIVQSLWLAYDMGFISVTSDQHSLSASGAFAGVIEKAENKLRRRSLNSLVWENSQEEDLVYYYDSVLTLSQSTAQLKLDNGTEISLSENTLVTLEPPENQRQGEIRLKFTRGNIKARNTFAQTKIENKEFTINLSKESQLEVRQLGDSTFEVQVQKGEAQVMSASGKHTVSSDNLLRISKGESQSLDFDKKLQWINPPKKRIYTHKKKIKVQLQWSGQAEHLVVRDQFDREKKFKFKDTTNSKELLFPIGLHRIFLQRENSVSQPIDIQVWKAPLLHLVQPLPRNRAEYGEQVFLWTPLRETTGYVFKTQGNHYNNNKEYLENRASFRFTKDDDLRWSVWGKDKDGFLIPPPYDYPLYIRENPFAPPLLIQPKLRKPATPEKTPSALWWQSLLIPTAHAQTPGNYEAFFSWQSVGGADLYFLEISETPDFRKPIVKTSTNITSYNWKNIDKQKKYYWRVAAGSQSGRMGIFTEPALVVLQPMFKKKPSKLIQQVKQSTKVESKPVVTLKKIQKNSSKKEIAEKPSPKPLAIKRVTEGIDKTRFRLLWRGGYGLTQDKSPQKVDARLHGLKLISLSTEYHLLAEKRNWWTLGLKYTMTKFKATPKDSFPFQKDLNVQQGELQLSRRVFDSFWGYGVLLKMAPNIVRTNLESVRVEENMAFAPIVRGLWSFRDHRYTMYIGPLVGSDLYGIVMSHRILFSIFHSQFLIGFELDIDYIIKQSQQTLNSDLFFQMGFEF